MAKEEFDFSELTDFTDGSDVEFVAGESPAPVIGEQNKNTPNSSKNIEDEFQFIEEEFKEPSENEKEPKKASKEDNKEKNPSSQGTEDASDSFALNFARFQVEEGLISELDEEELKKIETIEKEEGKVSALKYLAEIQRNAAFEEAKKVYSEDRGELEEYFELKDAGVDSDVAKELAYNKATFDKVTEEVLEADEDLQKKILYQHYKNTTSFSDEKIKKEIQKSFNSGENIEDAKEALEQVKVFNAKKIEYEKKQVEEYNKQIEIQRKAEIENMKKLIQDTEEIIPGQKLNKVTKQKLEDMILKPASKDANGTLLNAIWTERAKDPKAFDLKLAYHILAGTFNGKVKPLEKQAKTEAVKNLEKMINNSSVSLKGKSTIEDTGVGADTELFKMLGL